MLMFGDLEQFAGSDGGGEVSESALEAFREQMRAAARQIKALQKGEQKKKKKEEKLAKIIAQFLQKKSEKTEIAILAAKVLANNVPASFVLSMILLDDPETQQELLSATNEEAPAATTSIAISEADLSLIPTNDDETSARFAKAFSDWIELMYQQAATDAMRVQQHSVTDEGEYEPTIIELLTIVILTFAEEQGCEVSYEACEQFANRAMQKVFGELARNLERLESIREKEFEAPPQE